MPPWAGVDVDALMSGFGTAELVMAFLFAFLLSIHMVKRLLAAAGIT